MGGAEQAAKAPADHQHLDAVVQGGALESRLHIGVVHIVGEIRRDLDVLPVAVRAQPLVPLPRVDGHQFLRVEVIVAHQRFYRRIHRHPDTLLPLQKSQWMQAINAYL